MKNVSKMIFKTVLVLVLALGFYGCKGDVDGNPAIKKLFYTTADPSKINFDMLPETKTLFCEPHTYYLAGEIYNPNQESFLMIMEYVADDEVQRKLFGINPVEGVKDQFLFWSNLSWPEGSEEDEKKLKFYLVDENMDESEPYYLTIKVW